jgi:hypothetical protein
VKVNNDAHRALDETSGQKSNGQKCAAMRPIAKMIHRAVRFEK